jgi:hypothetical protein
LSLLASFDDARRDLVDRREAVEFDFLRPVSVNGVECEHLAFRNDDTDWQIWVQVGPNPIPCKFVITSKAMASGPQYTLLITDWKSDATIPSDAFTYNTRARAARASRAARGERQGMLAQRTYCRA